jgi:hypothetical protein
MELMIILEAATLLVMFCRGWYNAFSLLCVEQKMHYLVVLTNLSTYSALWLSLRRRIKHSASLVGWQH